MKRLFILSVLNCFVNMNKLPSQFKRCSSKDQSCLAEAITDALNNFKGIPELGVSNLNPMYIPKVSFPAGPKIVQVQQNFENLELSGYDHAKVTKVDFNLKKGKVRLEVFLPLYYFKGDYDYDGYILGSPIKGKGKSVFTFTNIAFIQDFETEVYRKDGEDFLKFKKSTLQISHIEKIEFQFRNLYDGDEKKSAEMHKLMNTKWQDLLGEAATTYIPVLEGGHLKIANELFSKVPLSEIFLKD